MPSPQALGSKSHLDIASRFFAIAEGSDKATGDARAWTIVYEFYAAVHWVRAYITNKKPGTAISSHEDIREYFEQMPEMKKVKHSYDMLKQSSQAVRYYGTCDWPAQEYTLTRQAAKQVRGWSVPLCKDP